MHPWLAHNTIKHNSRVLVNGQSIASAHTWHSSSALVVRVWIVHRYTENRPQEEGSCCCQQQVLQALASVHGLPFYHATLHHGGRTHHLSSKEIQLVHVAIRGEVVGKLAGKQAAEKLMLWRVG